MQEGFLGLQGPLEAGVGCGGPSSNRERRPPLRLSPPSRLRALVRAVGPRCWGLRCGPELGPRGWAQEARGPGEVTEQLSSGDREVGGTVLDICAWQYSCQAPGPHSSAPPPHL